MPDIQSADAAMVLRPVWAVALVLWRCGVGIKSITVTGEDSVGIRFGRGSVTIGGPGVEVVMDGDDLSDQQGRREKPSMKDYERDFMLLVLNWRHDAGEPVSVRECMRRFCGRRDDVGPKQLYRVMERWGRRGWYDWAAVLELGWLTDKGLEVARGLK